MELTDTELVEEIAKMLTANNPNAPENIVRFNTKEKCFKPAAIIEQSIMAYSSEGWVIHQVSARAPVSQLLRFFVLCFSLGPPRPAFPSPKCYI